MNAFRIAGRRRQDADLLLRSIKKTQENDAAGKIALHNVTNLLADGLYDIAIHRTADIVQNRRSFEKRRDAAGEALEFFAG